MEEEKPALKQGDVSGSLRIVSSNLNKSRNETKEN